MHTTEVGQWSAVEPSNRFYLGWTEIIPISNNRNNLELRYYFNPRSIELIPFSISSKHNSLVKGQIILRTSLWVETKKFSLIMADGCWNKLEQNRKKR